MMELGAPDVLVEATRQEVAQVAMALTMPTLLGHGAVFDSLKGLVQEAAGVCVRRPVMNIGLGSDAGHFEPLPRALRRPSDRACAASNLDATSRDGVFVGIG
jgi:hypothetical protein